MAAMAAKTSRITMTTNITEGLKPVEGCSEFSESVSSGAPAAAMSVWPLQALETEITELSDKPVSLIMTA